MAEPGKHQDFGVVAAVAGPLAACIMGCTGQYRAGGLLWMGKSAMRRPARINPPAPVPTLPEVS